jgi:hypothetical protein
MESAKFVGMDVHKEHADFPIMPNLGKSLSQPPAWRKVPSFSYELHSA